MELLLEISGGLVPPLNVSTKTSVHFSNSRKSMASSCLAIHNSTRRKVVSFCIGGVGELKEGIDIIGILIGANPVLHTLNIKCTITEPIPGLGRLSDMIKSPTTSLFFGRSQTGFFFNALKTNTRLKKLTLEHFSLTRDDLFFLAEALRVNTTLQELNFIGCLVDDTPQTKNQNVIVPKNGLIELCNVLKSHNSTLQVLRFFIDPKKVTLNFVEITFLGEMLQSNTTLSSFTFVGDKDCFATGRGTISCRLPLFLKFNSTITHLNLSDNAILRSHLVSLLGEHSQLVKSLLDLDVSGAREDCSDIVCDFIFRSDCIERVNAGVCTLTSKHFNLLSRALKKTKTLWFIGVSWDLDSISGEELLEGLQENTSLTVFHPLFPSCFIGDLHKTIPRILERNKIIQSSLFKMLRSCADNLSEIDFDEEGLFSDSRKRPRNQ